MQEIIKIFHFSIDRSFFGAYHNGCKKCIGKKVEKMCIRDSNRHAVVGREVLDPVVSREPLPRYAPLAHGQ